MNAQAENTETHPINTETISFNSLGQWSLQKRNTSLPIDADYMSYRGLHLQGTLQTDKGTRGVQHGGMSTGIPKQMSDHKMEAEVPTPKASVWDDIHPGRAEQTDEAGKERMKQLKENARRSA